MKKRRVRVMEEVRNAANKLVCRIDRKKKIVEIVMKGCKTQIRFSDDGTAEVKNSKAV